MKPLSGDEQGLARAKNTAYRLLTIRSRSRAELEQKLRDKEFSAEIVGSVVGHLLRLGYLDDAKFAFQWAAGRVRTRGFGRRRIEQELGNKGIAPDIIKDTLGNIFEDLSEADLARKEADRKLVSLRRFPPEVCRRRLAGFLERKGYSSSIIHGVLRALV